MDLGCLQGFSQSKGRENGWQSFCKHCFARTWRANKYGIMSTCGGYLESPFYIFLTFYITEINIKILLSMSEFLPCDYSGCLQAFFIPEKMDYFIEMLHPKYIQ